MLNAGAGIVAGSLYYFSEMFTRAFQLEALVVNNDAYSAMLADAFALTPIILIFGMLLNIVLAKFTPFKYLFLAGNVALYMAGIITMIFTIAGLGTTVTLVVGPILLALYMTFSPAFTQKYTSQISESKELAIANPGNNNYFLAGWLGSKFGNKEKTTEDIKVPKALSFLQDSTVTMAVAMSLLFIFMSAYVGPEFVETNLSQGQNYIAFSFMQSITFTVDVLVLMSGINMAVNELIPAFGGIGDKLIDGVVPAVDGAVMAKYSPNAMLIGFIVSLGANIVTMFLLTLTSLLVVIPSVLQHFFVGGIAATYGNKTGGRRGAVLGALVNGLMMGILPSIYIVYSGDGLFTTNIIFSDADFAIVGILIEFFVRMF